jgi:hypothetical protein
MEKEKEEKMAMFRFGVISRLLWVKEDECQHQPSQTGNKSMDHSLMGDSSYLKFLRWGARHLASLLFTLNWYPFYQEKLQRLH